MLTRADMHAYQQEDVEFFWTHPKSFGLIDMGLGKTVTAGTVIARWLDETLPGKVLIVGPIAVISSSWPDEFAQWEHLSPYSYTVLRLDDDDPAVKRASGTERLKMRAALAAQPTSIHLINYEALPWLVELWGRRWPYKVVILDEVSLIKNHASNRFKALQTVQPLIQRIHMLTATPATEGIEALFAPTYLLDGGQRLGKDITWFRKKWMTENRYTFKWTPRPDAENEIIARLADVATVRRRRDHFDAPEAMVIQRRIQLSPRAKALYDKMVADSILALPDGTEIEAETAAALSQKLTQLSSGHLYETAWEEDPDDEAQLAPIRRVHHIHDHKIEMLQSLVEELDGHNLLVAYQHRASLDRLMKAFPQAVKWDKAGKTKAPWNAGKIPMMLMHPRSGGHGNNLQKGGHHIVFFDIPWSREQFVQLVGRLDRQGQTNHVNVILLVATGTIDETIAQAQRDKKDAEEALFTTLRRMITALRKTSH